MRKNLFYYLKKFGHYSMSQFVFNEVDALILSELAYLDFDGIVPRIRENAEAVDFETLNNENLIKKMTCATLPEKDNIKLLNLMFKTERFKNMKLNFYRSRFDANLELQFSAVVFIFDECNFIAFRGTDTTLIGWKEDFNMSYLEIVPSQEQCLIYLKRVASKLNGKFYLGGHSKGGNLACYAGIHTDKDIQERIEKIYDFDGPGFKYDVFGLEKFRRVKDKIKKYITRDSMIGLIMHNIKNYEVVKCYGVMLMQHDPFRWRVTKDGRLDTTESTTFNCQVFEQSIKDVMIAYSDEERSKIIDILFDLLNATEKSTIIEFKSAFLECYKAVKKRYKQLDEETVKYLKRIFKEYWNIYFYNRKVLKQKRKNK